MRHIPLLLIYSRFLIGLVLVALCWLQVNHAAPIAIGLLTAGLLTDVFDGIIARRLNVSTRKLRRLDSTVDLLFWCLVGLAVYLLHPGFFYRNYTHLLLLFGTEALTYLVCFVRFRKEVATHAISSKIWALVLFATLVQVMGTGNSEVLFQVCFYFGVLTRLEILAILFLLRTWTNDVPSVYHAVLLRQGKAIKRSKLFNG